MWRNIWGPVVPGPQHERHHSRVHTILSGCWRLFWLSAEAARFLFISRTMTGHRDKCHVGMTVGLWTLHPQTSNQQYQERSAGGIVNCEQQGYRWNQTGFSLISNCFHSVGFHEQAAAVWFSPTRQRRQIQLKVVDCQLTTKILCDTRRRWRSWSRGNANHPLLTAGVELTLPVAQYRIKATTYSDNHCFLSP